MPSFSESMIEYKRQMEKGDIRVAYKGLMDYLMRLRSHFDDHFPDFYVSGSIYYGYMDMSYFSATPRSLEDRKLKVAIVFIHETCRFEIWLAGINKQVQSTYWKLLKEAGWNKYKLVTSIRGSDSILEHTLAEQPDFNDLEALTRLIEQEAILFIAEVEDFLFSNRSINGES